MYVTPFVLFLIVSSFAVGTVAPCNAHDKTVGCIAPYGSTGFYEKHFKLDCDKFGICYSCVRMESEKFLTNHSYQLFPYVSKKRYLPIWSDILYLCLLYTT